MDARDLFASQLEVGAKQVGKVLLDWPEGKWDERLAANTMSARETVVHLTECYHAAQAELEGRKHSWGTYEPVSDETQRLVAEMRKQWDVMKAAALATDPEHYNEILAYTTNHDCYHVGQLCSLRLMLQPDWDAYSIYS